VDVVLDTIGGETRERSWQVLKPTGILVSLKAMKSGRRPTRRARPIPT
jgi:NADPH:quinone reductase-like Zn-dependent oxidoreductase